MHFFALVALAVLVVHASAAIFVASNVNDSGPGSLRQAIMDANANPNGATPDEIDFNIPGTGVQTIFLATALPTIIAPVIIDGWTQPGWNGAPLIEVTAQPGVAIDGLTISAGSTTIRGLVLNGFGKAIAVSSNGNNTISGCYLGTNNTATAAVPNNIAIYFDRTSNNVIGGTAPEARNVISGNRQQGVYFDETFSSPSSGGNIVQGNYIGTDVGGVSPVPNDVGIYFRQKSNNLVGGVTQGARNLISGNRHEGLFVGDGGLNSAGNVVQGNYIGTDVTGTRTLPNFSSG